MKVVLTAAVSLDGFIATEDGNSDWVLDDKLFDKITKDFGCVVLGRTTFEQYEGDIYPLKGIQHIMLTSKPAKSKRKNVQFVGSVEEAITKAKELGFKKLLVIGGAKTNASFAEAGVLTGMMVDVHPIKLGKGKKLFGDFSEPLKLKLLSRKEYPGGFTHMVYKVT